MKRIIVFMFALILLTGSALASGLEDLIEGHNLGCIVTGAAKIEGEPEIEKGMYTFHVSDHVNVIFSMDGENMKSFSCVCLDDSAVGEFLAQCVASFYNIGGLMAYSYCYDPVLTDFLSARAGKNPGSNKSVDGLLFQIVKESFGYAFIVVKVK